MAVYFHLGRFYREIGSDALLHSFFSTISYHLEPEGWGSRFPELMNDLYQGELPASKAEKVLLDMRGIQQALKAYSKEQLVWDIENLSLKPPGDESPDQSVSDLSHCFVTSTGKDLIAMLIDTLEYQVKADLVLCICEGIPDLR